MTYHLTLEASYRLHERLGMILGDRPATPAPAAAAPATGEPEEESVPF